MASSKGTANTMMYSPSSFNDTVGADTLSSISEKSKESYTQNDTDSHCEQVSFFYLLLVSTYTVP